MFWQGLIFWYDNYGLWPWLAKPRPKTTVQPPEIDLGFSPTYKTQLSIMSETGSEARYRKCIAFGMCLIIVQKSFKQVAGRSGIANVVLALL